jgi:uncharacterized membrane protein YjjB (DUF3815 family)
MNFFTTDLLVKLITSVFASIAFAILFKVNKRHLLYIAISSPLTYAVYHTIIYFSGSDFSAAFISTLVAAIISEIFARTRKAPTLIFLFPSVISTVPGGNLYYAMKGMLTEDYTSAFEQLLIAIRVGIGIAGGIVTVSIIVNVINDIKNKRKAKR